ncbi:hypothetical protein pipiens_012004 [Culex pipiens pipiens]|uniref:Nuclear RNA export factor Tap RNA-binding domain-containing protein n=1 Tax=Culex pipiens pipiens TaxID=38569 RepID=A0ABD1D414_CULPP
MTMDKVTTVAERTVAATTGTRAAAAESFTKPQLFIPHYWKVEDTAVSFYIEDFTAAETLQRMDRTIVRNGSPQCTVNK